MQGTRKLLLTKEITTDNRTYTLSLEEEDLSVLYPGMIRYTVRVLSGDGQIALFRTNTYEYAPAVPLEAGKIAKRTAEEWEAELVRDPAGFASAHRESITRVPPLPPADIVVIQGSPRPGGNCTTMAVWASEAARALGRTVQLIFPDELDIRPCIGCYQCYNTGTCTFTDDMTAVIPAIRGSKLLVVCSPVYTETVRADGFAAAAVASALPPGVLDEQAAESASRRNTARDRAMRGVVICSLRGT